MTVEGMGFEEFWETLGRYVILEALPSERKDLMEDLGIDSLKMLEITVFFDQAETAGGTYPVPDTPPHIRTAGQLYDRYGLSRSGF